MKFISLCVGLKTVFIPCKGNLLSVLGSLKIFVVEVNASLRLRYEVAPLFAITIYAFPC
jgi:hypothetical protein